jgi:hypothetical protein
MNLPTHSTFEQGTAHLRANFLDPLLLHSAPCKAGGVMVAHVRAQSVSSVRYPSPAGRCGPPQGCTPCFFHATGGEYSRPCSLARRPLLPNSWFVGAAKTARIKPIRGKETCEHLQNGLRPSVPLRFSRAAEKHLQNKRSWEQERALELLQSPKATWAQARSSERWAMWPTARNSRRTVNRVTAAPHGARHDLKAMFESSSDVAFFMHSGGRIARLQRLNEEGTDHV